MAGPAEPAIPTAEIPVGRERPSRCLGGRSSTPRWLAGLRRRRRRRRSAGRRWWFHGAHRPCWGIPLPGSRPGPVSGKVACAGRRFRLSAGDADVGGAAAQQVYEARPGVAPGGEKRKAHCGEGYRPGLTDHPFARNCGRIPRRCPRVPRRSRRGGRRSRLSGAHPARWAPRSPPLRPAPRVICAGLRFCSRSAICLRLLGPQPSQ